MTQQRPRVFVAGATGAIGRPLCRLLVDDGWSVVGTTRSSEKAAMLREIGVEPVVGNVFDLASLMDIVRNAQPEVVIHQLTDLPPALDAAKLPDALIRNAHLRDVGTRHLIAAAAAAGATRMVAQSIAFAYAPGAKPYREDAPLNLDPGAGPTGRGVASLEQQVLAAPFTGVVLRYGQLYGPGTGFDTPPAGGPLHVDAAADAARRAATRGATGIYNVAEDDGTVSIRKVADALGWTPDFRLTRSAPAAR